MPEPSPGDQPQTPAPAPATPAVAPADPIPEPAMPKPSAMVEPFDGSGTVPNLDSPAQKKRHPVGVLIAVLILLLITGGAGVYYFVLGPGKKPVAVATPTPAPSSSPTPTPDISADLTSLDTLLGAADLSLRDVDTTLTDKAGDLSE